MQREGRDDELTVNVTRRIKTQYPMHRLLIQEPHNYGQRQFFWRKVNLPSHLFSAEVLIGVEWHYY